VAWGVQAASTSLLPAVAWVGATASRPRADRLSAVVRLLQRWDVLGMAAAEGADLHLCDACASSADVHSFRAGRGGDGAGDGDDVSGRRDCVEPPFRWLGRATDAGGAEVAAALLTLLDEFFFRDASWQDPGRAVGDPPMTAGGGEAVVMADRVCLPVCLRRSVGGEVGARLLQIE